MQYGYAACYGCGRLFKESDVVEMRYMMTHRCSDGDQTFDEMLAYEREFADVVFELPKGHGERNFRTMFGMKELTSLEQNDHPSRMWRWLEHEKIESVA